MFSTSMIASSTTSPIAITRPGQDHRVDRRPRVARITSVAAISESGIAVRLIRAVRQSNRNATRMTTTRTQPTIIASREVVQRPLDERRGAEDGRVDVDALQARLAGRRAPSRRCG